MVSSDIFLTLVEREEKIENHEGMDHELAMVVDKRVTLQGIVRRVTQGK